MLPSSSSTATPDTTATGGGVVEALTVSNERSTMRAQTVVGV
jgi:hypothetical protein